MKPLIGCPCRECELRADMKELESIIKLHEANNELLVPRTWKARAEKAEADLAEGRELLMEWLDAHRWQWSGIIGCEDSLCHRVEDFLKREKEAPQ